MGELVQTLNAVSPIGLAAALAYIIYLLVRNKKRVQVIETNHLHCLPEIVASLRRLEDTMDRVNDNIVYIRARINGR